MPPKRKEFLKPKPKGKLKPQEPQTENDFLEAADEYEQAAGKWRAGDAAKAARFFNRAIDIYNEGLRLHPQSFDLAYNKANLLYNIAEDERSMSQFGNRTALLEQTLDSHRFAVSLNPTNTDILFNTAQVLTSLAEARLESDTQEARKQDARPLLEEAVEIFKRCLDSQQQEYTQIQAEIAKAQASGEYREAWEGERQQESAVGEADEDMKTESSDTEAPGDWATVEEPLTPESILETCTAQLNALTTLLGLYNPALDISGLEKKAEDGLETATQKIPILLDLIDKSPSKPLAEEPKSGPTLSLTSTPASEEASTTPKDDALLAVATFQASIAEIQYRSGKTDATTYTSTIDHTFSSLQKPISQTPSPTLATINLYSAHADALIDLASALSDGTQYTPSAPTFETDTNLQWTALSQSQTILTTLSSAPQSSLLSPSRLSDVFLARGDTDLFRFRISLFSTAKPAWRKSGTTLVGNAGVFYRGARSWAERAGVVQAGRVADAKAVVAEVLKEGVEGTGSRKEGWKGKRGVVEWVLAQMVEEGIVGRENVEGILGMVG
ncbi:hypothetical protein COCVIDRAFT_92266 [Bipolaris victoriae FI3]|uniref:Uncharacterized protein n=1 Tax=Bipolaris victoriae (strain FI3) TaxID=930091 RepID=W7ENR0_BIPV3|nr:hypothetical protein COCVIDRAFT_92266 [Bipolaris victoriae FI3]